MRWYCVDELTGGTVTALAGRMAEKGWSGSLAGLYWLPLPEDLLSPLQREHLGQCGPYALAIELDEQSLRLELLVRARGQLRCDCIAQASPEVLDHAVRILDQLLELASLDTENRQAAVRPVAARACGASGKA